METYLFVALIFIYALTVILLPRHILQKIWTAAYIISFIITSIAIGYIKIYATDTLMKVGEINWYYILYIFGSLSIILGIINLWMYKRGLWQIFTAKNNKEETS